MDFMADYWLYHSCYEIPRNYAWWAGLATISGITHRKLIYYHGDLEIPSMMYVGLIGPQGNSKSTCCAFAEGFFRDACPDALIGPSRASPEILVKLLAEADAARTFTNHANEQVEVRPYAFFIHELKNFVGRSPLDMITLLTDIYDKKIYDGSSIARGVEYIINPAVNILLCETPEWLIRNLKSDVVSGGFSRRIIYVNEMYGTESKPFIVPPTGTSAAQILEAKSRIKQRLIDIRKVVGEFKWSTGKTPYEKWYNDNFKLRLKETNPVMQGYLKSKNTQLYKVMMCLDAVTDKPMLSFTSDLVDTGLALLNIIEKNMPKLSTAAGRNEMMGAQQKLLEIIHNFTFEGIVGWIPEKQLRREIEGELNPSEIYSIMRHLEETEQVVKKTFAIPNSEGVKIERLMVILPKTYEELKKNGNIKPK